MSNKEKIASEIFYNGELSVVLPSSLKNYHYIIKLPVKSYLEGLVEFFLLKLQLKKSTVHLVHEQHRLDALSNGLAKDSLSLHTHT